MDDGLDRRDERRDRRLRIAIRLVLYPLALGLIALAWQQYHGAPSRAHATRVVQWHGVTSQGMAMQAETHEGLLTGFNTYVVEQCSDGSKFTMHWFPAQQRFVQHGEELRGRQAGAGRAFSGKAIEFDERVRARVDAHPHGTIRTRTSFAPARGTVGCESGTVTFSLRTP